VKLVLVLQSLGALFMSSEQMSLYITSRIKFCLFCFLTSEMMSKSCSNSEGQSKLGIYFFLIEVALRWCS